MKDCLHSLKSIKLSLVGNPQFYFSSYLFIIWISQSGDGEVHAMRGKRGKISGYSSFSLDLLVEIILNKFFVTNSKCTNHYIFAVGCCRPSIFYTMKSPRSNSL